MLIWIFINRSQHRATFYIICDLWIQVSCYDLDLAARKPAPDKFIHYGIGIGRSNEYTPKSRIFSYDFSCLNSRQFKVFFKITYFLKSVCVK